MIKSIEEINCNWLNRVLKTSNSNRIVDYEIWYKGSTGVSNVVNLNLIYIDNENKKYDTVFIKFAKLNLEGKPIRSAEKELYFYRYLAKDIGLSNIPKFIYGEMCSKTKHFTIILENLAVTHDSGRWEGESNWRQKSLVIKTLAELHCKWWNLKGINSDFKYLRDRAGCDKEIEFNLGLRDNFISNNSELFSERVKTIFKYGEENYLKYRDRYLTGENLTLIHRDCHHWNFMYPKDQSSDIYLIDWDTYRVDLPTNDLAYYIAVHLNREEREKEELKLLELYHHEITTCGIDSYSFDNLINDYKLSVLSMIYLAAVKERLLIPKDVWAYQFNNIIDAIEDLFLMDKGAPEESHILHPLKV